MSPKTGAVEKRQDGGKAKMKPKKNTASDEASDKVAAIESTDKPASDAEVNGHEEMDQMEDNDESQEQVTNDGDMQDEEKTEDETQSVRPASSSLMSRFWGLASLNAAERIEAAAALLPQLKASQAEFSGDGLCPDLEYSFKRLVRGMGSNRKAARQGFGVALCEVLAQFPEISVDRFVRVVETEHALTGATKDQRECQYGRLFSYGALVQSGRLRDSATVPSGIINQVTKHLLSILAFKNYTRPPACQVLCALVQMVSLPAFKGEILSEIASIMSIDKSTDNTDKSRALTPDGLCLLIASEEHLRALVSSRVKLPSGVDASLLKDRLVILELQPKAVDALNTPLNQAALTHPMWEMLSHHLAKQSAETFSAAWNKIVDRTLLGRSANAERKSSALNMLRLVATASPHLVHLTLSPQLTRQMLQSLSVANSYLHDASKSALAALLAAVSQPNTPAEARLKVLAHLTGPSGSKRFDTITKTSAVKDIMSTLSLEEVTQYVLTLQSEFVDPPQLARRTGEGAAEDVQSTNEAHRCFVLDQMLALFRNARVPKNEDWTSGCVLFCLIYGFFEVGEHAKAAASILGDMKKWCIVKPLEQPLSPRTLSTVKSRFTSFLSDLCTSPSFQSEGAADDNTRKLPGLRPDGEYRIAYIVSFIHKLVNKVPLQTAVTDEQRDAFNDLVTLQGEVEKTVQAKRSTRGKKAQDSAAVKQSAKAFRLLILHTVALFLTEPASVASTAPDLRSAFADLCAPAKSSKSKKSNPQKESDEDSNDVDAASVVVDILLSMLSQPSALLRSAVTQVFTMMCDTMSSPAIELLGHVISNDKPVDAEGDEEDEDDDENEDDDDDDDEEEEDEQTEENGASSEQKTNKVTEESEVSDDDSDDDDSDVDVMDDSDDDDDDERLEDDAAQQSEDAEEKLLALKRKLAAALKVPMDENGYFLDGDEANEKPSKESDAEDSEDDGEESDWDDEQMMAVDSAIAQHFREHMKGRKKTKKAEQQLNAQFKLRVLDLIDIYIRKQSSNPSALLLVPALLKAVTSTQLLSDSGANLKHRIVGIVTNKFANAKALPSLSSDEDIAMAHSMLKSCLTSMLTQRDKEYRAMTEACARILLRSLTHGALEVTESGASRHIGQLDCNVFEEVYGDICRKFLSKKKWDINPQVLLGLTSRFPAVSWLLVPIFADAVANACTPVRWLTAAQFVSQLVTQKRFVLARPQLLKQYGAALVQFFVNATTVIKGEMQDKFKPAQVRVLTQSALFVARLLKLAEVTDIDTTPLGDVATTISQSKYGALSPAVFTPCKQLLQELGVDVSELKRPDAVQFQSSKSNEPKSAEKKGNAKRKHPSSTSGAGDGDGDGAVKKRKKKSKKKSQKGNMALETEQAQAKQDSPAKRSKKSKKQ
eukprot:m.248172 g.248172  ORF g.248172 m.248172 type:complete len:1393 (-) comp17163_c1_seq1:3493-7671(-)